MGKLQDKVAIVVGATSGIGLAVAKAYVNEGAKVVFTGRRQEKGEAILEEMGDKAIDMTFIKADSTSNDDNQNVVDTAIEKYGKIDILAIVAGVEITQLVEEMKMDDLKTVFETNYFGYVDLINKTIPHMKENGGGSIINTTSVASFMTMPTNSPYASSKIALTRFTETAARELGAYNIRLNCLAPGVTITEMVPEGSSAVEHIVPLLPIKRPATAEEMAFYYVFLAQDESQYLTGITLKVDGGMSLVLG